MREVLSSISQLLASLWKPETLILKTEAQSNLRISSVTLFIVLELLIVSSRSSFLIKVKKRALRPENPASLFARFYMYSTIHFICQNDLIPLFRQKKKERSSPFIGDSHLLLSFQSSFFFLRCTVFLIVLNSIRECSPRFDDFCGLRPLILDIAALCKAGILAAVISIISFVTRSRSA